MQMRKVHVLTPCTLCRIELLLEEVEAASCILRSYIEPLIFAASCRKELTCPGSSLLQLKYHSLVGYIVAMQAFVCAQIEGEWSPKHPVNTRVESAWARLEVTKSLEQIYKGDVQDLIFMLTVRSDPFRGGDVVSMR